MTPVSDVLRAAAQAVANDPTHDDYCWPSEGQHSDACNRKRQLRAALAHAAPEGLDAARMTHAWAILTAETNPQRWEPDRYNAAAFVTALLVEYARLSQPDEANSQR